MSFHMFHYKRMQSVACNLRIEFIAKRCEILREYDWETGVSSDTISETYQICSHMTNGKLAR